MADKKAKSVTTTIQAPADMAGTRKVAAHEGETEAWDSPLTGKR